MNFIKFVHTCKKYSDYELFRGILFQSHLLSETVFILIFNVLDQNFTLLADKMILRLIDFHSGQKRQLQIKNQKYQDKFQC